MNEPVRKIKEGVEVVREIMNVAGKNPDVKASAENLGKTALTVTTAINNILLPIAAVNFAFDKARKYFSDKFQVDLTKKTSSIPPEMIVEPKASIAGPVLQGLAFTHEEPSLKDLYLNLLASAMDKRISDEAHPAFVEVIKQLNSEEAVLLKELLESSSAIAIVEIREETVGQPGYVVVLSHLLNLRDKDSQVFSVNERITAMVDNWIRLGLAEVDYSKHLVADKAYEWVENRPEYLKFSQESNGKEKKVYFHEGIILRTAFGFQFARACGIVNHF